MGTGLGPESYAIIEQGRIGQILSSKPQDRRAVIEEAAGITKYKTRKRLAEAKLESAKQNLARVFDILEEVTRQVNSLKRQAAKARRYDELKTEMDGPPARGALPASSACWSAKPRKTALDLNLASADLHNLSAQVAAQGAGPHRPAGQCLRQRSSSSPQRASELAECAVETERTRGRLESQVKESGAIEQRIAQDENETRELEEKHAKFTQDLESHVQALSELEIQTRSGAREVSCQKRRTRESAECAAGQNPHAGNWPSASVAPAG